MNFPTWLPFLLGLLAAVGPLATDMHFPAFDAIEAEFGSRQGSAQMTQGTLSDRFGRRRPLIVGMLVFAVACAGRPPNRVNANFDFVARWVILHCFLRTVR